MQLGTNEIVQKSIKHNLSNNNLKPFMSFTNTSATSFPTPTMTILAEIPQDSLVVKEQWATLQSNTNVRQKQHAIYEKHSHNIALKKLTELSWVEEYY